MGVDSKKAPPLPAPTETESTLLTPTEVATDVSKPGDERSSYSLPDDGTPVTIKTRGPKPNRSQTSLLIEYFEGGKNEKPGGSGERKPSVRVRLTPSKGRSKGSANDHIQITETKSSRRASSSRRAPLSPTPNSRSDLDIMSGEDDRSMHSYLSATEESNVSRNPIEVDIDPNRNRARRRKPSSPLIPAADSKSSSYIPPNASDISGIPTDSFLDGSGATTRLSDVKRTDSPSRGEALAAAGAGGLAAGALADKMNRRNRSRSRERIVVQKALEKASGKSDRERKHRSSRSRTSSMSEKEKLAEGVRSPRRRSSRSHQESVVSGADSSVLSSQMSPSHRSYETTSVRSGASKSSINNPKLLETVEDAIRRLILPELNALKREQSKRESRSSKDRRDSLGSSITSLSREDISTNSRRKSGGTEHSVRSKERRNREARHDLSPESSVAGESFAESDVQKENLTPKRSGDLLKAAAAGAAAAGLAAAAKNGLSSSEEKKQRRRRRTETPTKRNHPERYSEEFEDEEHHEVAPPMPLMSEINPSEMTRASILSAETNRPHSASEELTPVHEVSRGHGSLESIGSDTTPTKSQGPTLQNLGATHANISHGDLRALPRGGSEGFNEEYETDEYGQKYPIQPGEEFEDEYEETGRLAEPGMYDEAEVNSRYYSHQDVPPPLRYVPYQQERRGLSPIQSVSGYTEGESDVHNRDSRVTQTTTGSFSSPGKSPYFDRGVYSPNTPSNMRSREFGEEEESVRSSGVDFRRSAYTDDSELDRVTSGQAVRGVGRNPDLVVPPMGVESNVASLVDGSMIDQSVLSGSGHDYRDSTLTYDSAASAAHSGGNLSPDKASGDSRHVAIEERGHSPALSASQERNSSEAEFSEYDIDEYGRKVPRTRHMAGSRSVGTASPAFSAANRTSERLERESTRNSPTLSESRITNAAVGAAAAALRANRMGKPIPGETFEPEGVSRNKSFKERAKVHEPAATPRHSIDRLSEFSEPRLGASGLPDHENPMPEIGYYQDGHRSPSIVQDRLGGSQHSSREQWEELPTPTQETMNAFDRAVTPKASKHSGHGLGLKEAAGAAAIATAAGMAASHSRQPSQEQDDEWQRSSGDRKRDTLVTNPYEGASPIVNLDLPGFDGNSAYHDEAYENGNAAVHHDPDEGYISAAPKRTPEGMASKGKGVGFLDQQGMGTAEDPFYAPKHTRHLSGLSQGMGTPLYDAATGTGIDRIQSKDIIALMEHLMVRDAQRSARDTEMLVTLVRSAAEMRNSFEEIKRMLADTEDVIITEVSGNTEKTVQRHLGGPRPFPSSAPRSTQGGSQFGTFDDLPAKKQNLFRRALQGLGNKGSNDLGRIEDMLMQLLSEVDVLKAQTSGPGVSTKATSSDNMQPEGQYEQDRGYEPEGIAGTSTASYASQSGHLSVAGSRPSNKQQGYDRRFSDHRISTVEEADENDYDHSLAEDPNQYSNPDLLMTPAGDIPRGGSAPSMTPPGPAMQQQHMSMSNDNTPRTDDKKHKSRGSSSFFPKISRWSETTASSIGKAFRNSGRKSEVPQDEFLRHEPSRSGSDLAEYDNYHDPYGDDHLPTGYSEQDLPAQGFGQPGMPTMQHQQAPNPAMYGTPEDPKYKAHRNSLNLQHPQPRPGQTERFRTALESQALSADYDARMSPRSADWAGSATSLHRFPAQNTNRYSDNSAMQSNGGDDYNWASSPALAGPPRPPKEPLESPQPNSPSNMTSPVNNRINKLQKKQPSPLPYQSVESGYGTGTQTYHSVSPKLENRNLSGARGVPTRRPSGPRAMTPKSDEVEREREREERRRKRDTFGTIASQDSETF